MKKRDNSILGGVAIFFIGIGLLWWNEGNNVKNIQSVNEGLKNYVDISSETINPQYENKLVATSGKLDVFGEISDDTFLITTNSAALYRKVEMYQWKEECDDDSCTYTKVWDDNLIDSSSFEQAGHTNPDYMPYESKTFTSQNAKVGAFTLPRDLLLQLSTNNKIMNLSSEDSANHNMVITNNYYTTAKGNVNNIGDIRISFYDNDADTVSVLATQIGNSFIPYTTSSGKSLFKLYEGHYNGEEILGKITDENNILKWALRVLGVLCVISGISSLFKPLSILTGRIPILGDFVGTITGIVSFAIGLAISLLVIAIAWFRFRPLLSIILLAVVALVLVLLRIYTNRKKTNNQSNELNATSNVDNSNNGINNMLNTSNSNNEINNASSINNSNIENKEETTFTNQQFKSDQINKDENNIN